MNIIWLIAGLAAGCLLAAIVFALMHKQATQMQAENALLKQEKDALLPLETDNRVLAGRAADLQQRLDEQKAELQQKETAIQEQIRTIAMYKSRMEAMQEKLDTQKTEMQQMREELNKEFRLMANEILEEKTRSFSESNAEKIGSILNPLKEKIQLFEKKVEETYNTETREKASLRKELEQIININRQMSDDAQRLTSALKGDSKTQGDWGEMQLEMLLEKAGLLRDVHYTAQANLKTEAGANVRPDFIINLPEGKNYVIDSKVSLTAYERYYNADSDAERAAALKEHIQSLQKHIAELGAKNYQHLYGINSPDFVFLYVPVEPALTLALQHEAGLFDKALGKNVVLVSSSMLLATLRTVSFIWKQENQKNNVLEIAKESGALYDKFVGFTEDMLKLGNTLQNSKKTYDEAMNKLTSSTRKGDTVVGRIERLRKLGANTTKQIDQRLIERTADNELDV